MPSSRKGGAFWSIFSKGVRSSTGSSFFLERASLDGVEEACEWSGILSVTVGCLGANEEGWRGSVGGFVNCEGTRAGGQGVATHRAGALDLVEEAGHFGVGKSSAMGAGAASGLPSRAEDEVGRPTARAGRHQLSEDGRNWGRGSCERALAAESEVELVRARCERRRGARWFGRWVAGLPTGESEARELWGWTRWRRTELLV